MLGESLETFILWVTMAKLLSPLTSILLFNLLNSIFKDIVISSLSVSYASEWTWVPLLIAFLPIYLLPCQYLFNIPIDVLSLWAVTSNDKV